MAEKVDILRQEWEKIPTDTQNKLVGSMLHRYQTVIAAMPSRQTITVAKYTAMSF